VREKELQAIPHLVDEAIEEAILQGSQIEHVHATGRSFRRQGSLAAVLRFRRSRG